MLSLLIPQLRFASQPNFDPTAELALPGLTGLLGRARRNTLPTTSAEAWLRQQFQAEQVSAAALTLALDLPDAVPGHWLRADPVHLRADRDRALLFDATVLGLQQVEAEQLVASLNGLYSADGFQFVVANASRWYLRLPDAVDFQTTPLAAAVGKDVRPSLPSGPNALRWHRFLNEVQMLLYTQPVNDAREQAGLLAANSIWLWGEGSAPAGLHRPAAQLWANDALARGLAQAAGMSHAALPPAYQTSIGTDALVCLDELVGPAAQGDIYAWRSALERLEASWFKPVLTAWQAGRLDGLQLVIPGEAGTVCAQLSGADRWKFWRRPLPLARL